MPQKFSPEALTVARGAVSKYKLAQDARVPWAAIHAYENGMTTPTVARLCALADALGCDVAVFFRADDADAAVAA
ncbi:helix-turn-helix domain-containing protein [Streptomyces sp. AC602_WCS936]|uniref:helix-turn-helix domain-containing protein n=1 Tax=Streptomyces sp. AC602_WCS936 TaxID=2823685 RepID=UPI001C26C051|nr:helix-turn-helix transcriptional regulator [Streptomyces sp. AC602_WCS936]